MANLQEQDGIHDTVTQDTVESVAAEPIADTTDIPKAADVRTEEYRVSGDALLKKFNELIRAANVRRVLLKNNKGEILLDIPLAVGVVGGAAGVLLFPAIVAIAAVGALATHLTLVVEKKV